METHPQDIKHQGIDQRETLGGELNEHRPRSDSRSPTRSPTPPRQLGESSPTRSEYDEDVDEPAVSGVKIIGAYNSKSGFQTRLKNEQGITLFYVENSSFTPNKPDVTLHAGAEKTDPIVGVCKWSSMFSDKVTIGVGDPSTSEGDVVWEEMKSDRRHRTEYRWDLQLPEGGTKQFMWTRARGADKDVTGATGNILSGKNFKLVDVATGQVVVVFASNRFRSWHKLGKFKFFVDHGERWQFLTLLTGMALIEMSRRRSRGTRYGHGGGG